MSTDSQTGSADSRADSTDSHTGWWAGLTPRSRRLIRALVTFLGAGLIASSFGVLTATYEGSVGPHRAGYSVTLNSEIKFDMGPLGALIIDSPLPADLGVDVVVGQIPDELIVDGGTITAGADEAVAALTHDLRSYMQLFTAPQEAIREATKGLIGDAISRTVLGWSILLTVVLLGRLAAHGVFRAAVMSGWRQPGVPAVTATLLVVAVALSVIPATQGSRGAGTVSTVLAGTPLADARITGRLGALVDHYGKFIIDEIDANNDFYAEVMTNTRAAFAAEPHPQRPGVVLYPMPTVDGTNTQPHAFSPATDPMTMVVVSDLHCNFGMGEVAGDIAKLVDADLIINLGDAVLGGTSVEGVCVNSFADSFGDIPVVSADGNHDSAETAGQERSRGWQVLDGNIIEIEGLRILGDADPTLTSLGSPTRQVGGENIAERGERMTQIACEVAETDRVDLLLMHNHRATEAALASGCVDYAFAGHFHRRIGPWQRGLGVQYLSTSSGGAILNQPTIGPLSGTAGITIVQWDRARNAPLAMREVLAMPDTKVEISPWFDWPEPADAEVEHDWPDPADSPW